MDAVRVFPLPLLPLLPLVLQLIIVILLQRWIIAVVVVLRRIGGLHEVCAKGDVWRKNDGKRCVRMKEAE